MFFISSLPLALKELAEDHVYVFLSYITKWSDIMCEEAIQGRIVKITDKKLGHFSFSFSGTGYFLI